MEIKNKLRVFFSGIGILMLVLGLYAFKSESKAYQGYSPQPQWENLKVLPQDITKDSLRYLMKNFATSLGVKCNYCHASNADNPSRLDFSSDAKIEKEIARGMIKMTKDINENYFKPYFPEPKPQQVHVVSCVMCHRGTANPEKYLSQMGMMYKTYNPDRDNRKEKMQEEEQKH